MKTTRNKRWQIRTLTISLAGIVCYVFTAGAAQEPYDLDLKELRRPPVHRTKSQRKTHKPKLSVTAPSLKGGKKSNYTVRQGDHLFLILMKHYGLSNKAAEKLIPEIMQLNGMRRAESLSVGQRLIIPLPPITDTAAETASERGRKTLPSLQQAETLHDREITVTPLHPCQLAREVAEQLSLQISALPPFIGAEGLNVSCDARKIAVVCGLEPAEAYTLERLLAQQDVKLLLLKNDEPPKSVIEGIAGRLGIPFSVAVADNAAGLPLTYLFPAAIAGKDLRLTLRP